MGSAVQASRRPPGSVVWRAFDLRPPKTDRAFVKRVTGIAVPRVASDRLSNGAFAVLLLGIFLRFSLGPELLYLMHIKYSDTGGSPLTKVHPGTFVMILAMLMWLCAGGDPVGRLVRHYHKERAIFTFTAVSVAMVVYGIINHLSGTLSTFIDTFFSAGLAASLLINASVRQRDVLGRLLLWFLCINAAIAIGETLAQQPLLPQLPADAGGADLTTQITQSADYLQQFRGSGLYFSPLEGATITALGIFFLFRLRLPPTQFVWRFVLLLVGLISFGGRASLVVTGFVLATTGSVYIIRGLMLRRLRAETLGLALIVAVVLPLAMLWLIGDTPIGTRIAHDFYYDESAKVRELDWNIFAVLPFSNFLFGTDATVTTRLLFNINAGELENCWLAMFVDLGLVGFSIMFIGLAAFVIHLLRYAARGRESAVWGAILIVAFLVMISGFNSIGRKGCELLYLTAMIYAAAPVARLRRSRHQPRLNPGPSRNAMRAPVPNRYWGPATSAVPRLPR